MPGQRFPPEPFISTPGMMAWPCDDADLTCAAWSISCSTFVPSSPGVVVATVGVRTIPVAAAAPAALPGAPADPVITAATDVRTSSYASELLAARKGAGG
jgi:hypothetical protein